MHALNMEMKNYLQSLTTVEIENWEEVEKIISLKSYKKSEHFFQHFDKSTDVAIVKKGLFRIYLLDKEGEEKTFSFISENSFILDFFLSWEETSKTMVSVQALEDSEIYTINYQNFLNLIDQNKVWGDIFRDVLVKYYIIKSKREIEFVQFNAKERLKKFIDNPRLNINRIPKTYLASYLGIQPPSLSRLLRELKE